MSDYPFKDANDMYNLKFLEYKTDKLPLNFIYLGYLLIPIGIWRILANDWLGVIFLFIAVVLVFLRSGIIIDTENLKLKRYNGIFMIKKGRWEDIKQVKSLKILKTQETQTMSVVSISRSEIKEVFKLFLNLPDREIELMSGNKDDILDKAKVISTSISTTIINHID